MLLYLAFKAKPEISYKLSLTVILLSFFITLFLRNRERDFYYIPFFEHRDSKNWTGRGRFEYVESEQAFCITESHIGYIYLNSLNWSAYTMRFNFALIKDSLGVIVRAVNLSNYVMLQIYKDRIKPHIRINGLWRVLNEQSLIFDESLTASGGWHRCVLSVAKDHIFIKIASGRKMVFRGGWSIPPEVQFEIQTENKNQIGKEFSVLESPQIKESKKLYMTLPVNLEYGTIGFRDHGDEKALVRELLVKRD